MARRWPIPQPDRTFHLVGDVQGIPYLSAKQSRAEVVLADVARLPDVEHRVQVGDFVSSHADTAFPPTIEFMDKLGGGTWYATVGNHDAPIAELEPELARSADAAAVLMGMPGKNWVVDLGYAVLIGFYIRAWGRLAEEAPDFGWLADTLDEHEGRTCMVVAHPPIRGTITHNAAEMLTADDATLRSIIEYMPQLKVWLCGHTHSPLIKPVVQNVRVGSRLIAQVNGSALLNTAPATALDRWDPLRTLYVTVLDDRIEVRFRDHGAHAWIGGSVESRAVQVLPI